MKFLFIIQGEGRGHMTQALALRHILEDAGHELVGVCIGTSERRELPTFFVDKIGVEITRHQSPNFVTDEKNKGILIGASIWQNLLKFDRYLKSLATMDEVVEATRPDLVVNFYEPLWGLYQKRNPGKVRSVSTAHQFLAGHQDFPFPDGQTADRTLLKTLNRITASGSVQQLCLSFTPMAPPDDDAMVVVPPLLRRSVFELTPTAGEFLLVYVMQPGYGDDIRAWHEQNPEIEIHCFWDRKGAPKSSR